ncbi:hypothetical protein [Roseomonas gilardii]|uniref:hypothetical protein n=1 Tax=Roseomonas gilardii TaxID=257708 RepID=UPI00048612A0|nr:hypothetical protein [Roseomonas gilardii]SUE44920.1 Uncharacterised protein [Roseomonas gilardii subsp. rosea]
MPDDTASADPSRAGPPPGKGACAITGRTLPRKDLVPLALRRPSLAERLMQQHPGLTEESLVSRG